MAIELKDRMVTLEDLRAAYDDLVSKISGGAKVWHNITDELTWQTGKAVKTVLVADSDWRYSWETPSGSSDADIINCYYAEIIPTAGERYKVTGWATANISHGLFAVLDSSGNLIDMGSPLFNEIGSHDKKACGKYFYRSIEITVPKKAAKLMVLNWNKQMGSSYSLSDIIVEKEA